MNDTCLDNWLQNFNRQIGFLDKYPWYAFTLARLQPFRDPAVGVMAVSNRNGRFWLHVNTDFFNTKPQFLTGVLLHELHHVVLGHVTDPKFRDVTDPDLMQLAMEMSANEYICEPLPGQPVVWADYRQFGIARGQSTMHRYELLKQARLAGHEIRIPRPLDDHVNQGIGVGVTGPGKFETHRHLVDLFRQIGDGGDAHTAMAGIRSNSMLEALRGVDQAFEHTMDAKLAIRMFVESIRAPTATYARPNRRFLSQVGQIPGFTYARSRPSLLVGIDTSKSMSNSELSEVSRQLMELREHADMTVVECDTKIQRIYRFRATLESVAGRGGTDLRPLFAAEILQKHLPDGVVYFTDGEGRYPDHDPGIKTLWVLSKRRYFDCPWGRKVYWDMESQPGI